MTHIDREFMKMLGGITGTSQVLSTAVTDIPNTLERLTGILGNFNEALIRSLDISAVQEIRRFLIQRIEELSPQILPTSGNVESDEGDHAKFAMGLTIQMNNLVITILIEGLRNRVNLIDSILGS